MTAFREIARLPGGMALMAAALVLMTGQISVCLQTIRQRRSRGHIALTALHGLLGFLLMTLMLDGIYTPPFAQLPRTYAAPIRMFYSLPWLAVAGMEALSALLAGLCARSNLRYVRSHPGRDTVKEAMDLLPVGVCFSDGKGEVVMANLRMDGYCRSLTGRPLSNADFLRRTVAERGEEQDGMHLVSMADGTALLFAVRPVTVDGGRYDQLTAIDVTEQARITAELSEKNLKLRDIQYRMKAVQAQAADMFMEQELLAARVAVHDGLGSLLLQCRYYFEHPGALDEGELLEMMKRTNSYLLREAEEPPPARDHIEEALHMASGIGVRVELSGDLPENEQVRGLLGQAIGECAANAVKHADGNRLLVEAVRENGRLRVEITNNGAAPEQPVTETGGLRSLRRMTERAGGQMEVRSRPAFRLTLSLPVPEDGPRQEPPT